MATKRFQVQSEGLRVQAILDVPEEGETWPVAVVNHAAQRPKDAEFSESLVQNLNAEGIAVCRYDPRGFGESEGAAQNLSFWTRWLDLSTIVQFLNDDGRFRGTGLVGMGMGAVVSLWWAAVQDDIEAVVCLGLPAPKKLGALPRAVENRLPVGASGETPVDHPIGVRNLLLIYGEKDKEAAHAEETATQLGAQFQIVPAADKSFSAVRARTDANQRSVSWLLRHLRPAAAVSHPRESEEAAEATEAPPLVPPE